MDPENSETGIKCGKNYLALAAALEKLVHETDMLKFYCGRK